MYKVDIYDNSKDDYYYCGIIVSNEQSLKALMDFAWSPSKVNVVTTYNYMDIDSIKAFEVVATIFGEEDEHTTIHVFVENAWSVSELTQYFFSDSHYQGGDQFCARPVGMGDYDG